MKRNGKNGGFALPELLIGVILFAILLAAISGFLIPGVSSTKFAMSQEHSLSKARTAVNKIVDVIRYKPNTVTSPLATGTIVNQFTFLDAEANTYEIGIVTNDDGKKSITIEKNDVVSETVAEGVVKNINFSLDNDNSDQVTIELILNDNSYTGSPDVVLVTSVKMENL